MQENQLGSQATTANHGSDLYFILGDGPGLCNRLTPTPSSKATKGFCNELRFGIFLGISRQYSLEGGHDCHHILMLNVYCEISDDSRYKHDRSND